MSPVILMLSGWAGAGKDAAASLLIDEFGFARHAFADELKRDCAQLTGLPLHLFHSAEKDALLPYKILRYPTAQTPRDVLLLHAAAVRAMDTYAYSRIVAERILKQQKDGHQRFVISDWRYPEEFQYLQSFFYNAQIITCRIVRPGVFPSDSVSEHKLDSVMFDGVIVNDGGIADLRRKLRDLVTST